MVVTASIPEVHSQLFQYVLMHLPFLWIEATARIVLGAAEAHTEQQEQTYLNIRMEAYLKAYRLQRVDQPLNVMSAVLLQKTAEPL